MNPFKSFWQRVTSGQRMQVAKQINEHFRVEERNGDIYILCGGVAIDRISSEDTVLHLLQRLEGYRQDALRFESLID